MSKWTYLVPNVVEINSKFEMNKNLKSRNGSPKKSPQQKNKTIAALTWLTLFTRWPKPKHPIWQYKYFVFLLSQIK